ncbi:MAG: thiopurine S-methyltransferase [Woeseiaceae bacterium]
MTEQWLERWRIGRIGWHEAAGNRSLQKHWTASGKRILVPLCGKTLDLIWLERQGNEVVGVELSEVAVKAFFDENEIAYSVVDGALTAYVADDRAITIYCGDFFEFTEGPFDGHYDRGALVALPAKMRRDYVEHIRSLLSADATQLVISLEYDESIACGPPFSIPADEILAYWSGLERVDAYDDIENGPPKFLEAGLDKMIEVIWRSA